jgi:hypothetical protein
MHPARGDLGAGLLPLKGHLGQAKRLEGDANAPMTVPAIASLVDCAALHTPRTFPADQRQEVFTPASDSSCFPAVVLIVRPRLDGIAFAASRIGGSAWGLLVATFAAALAGKGQSFRNVFPSGPAFH